ncbi:hypothetical protein [Rubrolithibacter danxiaensis]|uniref:hypothetical protein n=1 Tax=Rubrolithibacter danxiaensis TaxID=3390805 RepID=UPI003BF7B98F
MKLNKKTALLVVVVLGLAWMIIDSFNQPSAENLRGGFKEKVFLRNEQNTGPIIRIYVVTVKDTLWQEMETYGNYKPHTKYGTTMVYYFLEGTSVPSQVSLEGEHISKEYQKHCIARYKKASMGQVVLNKRPFE